MQGHRSSKSPFLLTFDDSSSSDDTNINHLISFNNMHNSGHNNTLQDYLDSTDDHTNMYRHFETQQGHNFDEWTMGGTSSIIPPNHNVHSVRTSDNDISPDFNMGSENTEDDSDDCRILEAPPITFSTFSDRLWGQPSGSSNLFDSRRKRKSLERNFGQSSKGESSSNYQPSQGNVWQDFSGSSSNVSSSNHLVSSREVAAESPFSLNLNGNSQSSLSNYHSRTSPSHRVENLPLTRTSPPVIPSSTFDHFAPDQLLSHNSGTQRRSNEFHVGFSRRTLNSSRWTEGSSSRYGHLSTFRERNEVPQEDPNLITLPRNLPEHHPVFMPTSDSQNSAQNSVGSSSGTSHRHRPQYPRRLSELVRRSLLASADNEVRGSNSAVPSGAISSGGGNRSHRLVNPRSALLLNRQRNMGNGLPNSLQGLASASEGRSRLVSEIRSVLDLMHRNENIRFEDVPLLDHSMLLGMRNLHDRHRDMRLDVDNMSYEELLALEDRIGNVNTGLNEGMILNCMVQRKYFTGAMSPETEVEPCCVCQEVYNDGEDVGALECGHEFHSQCIKQWLMLKNLCPICKTTALTT